MTTQPVSDGKSSVVGGTDEPPTLPRYPKQQKKDRPEKETKNDQQTGTKTKNGCKQCKIQELLPVFFC